MTSGIPVRLSVGLVRSVLSSVGKGGVAQVAGTHWMLRHPHASGCGWSKKGKLGIGSPSRGAGHASIRCRGGACTDLCHQQEQRLALQ